MANLIGQRLGQYEIIELIGEGGMASVYRARQKSIGRDVAVKIIRADLTQTSDFLKRFQREGQTVAMLSHANILKVFDYGQDGNVVYLVMEYMPGGTLAGLLKSGALPLGRAFTYTEQIAAALDHAHRKGVIHRDLKPQNVLLDADGNAMLTDFGLAKVLYTEGATLTQNGALMGTPAYMSPEQWQGAALDARTDIYSLGVILYEMITGALPFYADTPYGLMHQHIYQAPPTLVDKREGLPPAVEEVLAKALAKNPDQRFQSAGELPAAFKAAMMTRNKPQAAKADSPKATAPKVDAIPAPPLTSLYTIFEYLKVLIEERGPDEPFLISQILPALTYKFQGFNFASYGLAGLRDFVLAGQKAEYFELVNTGDPKTSYLGIAQKAKTANANAIATEEMAANDPRRLRWMTLAVENLIAADRAEQLLDSIKGLNALTPEFDSFLAAQARNVIYPVKGKIKRVREFLKILAEKDENQAVGSWKVSRGVLRMPTIPVLMNLREAAGAQSLIWSLMQNTTQLSQVPIESLDNLFFAMLGFTREQMIRNRSWDWVVGLELLTADTRAIPRPAAPQKRGGLFGGKAPAPSPYLLDEGVIASMISQLVDAAGMNAISANTAAIYKTYAASMGLEGAIRFLTEHPDLIENDHLLNWLDEQISANVAAGQTDPIKNLANKSAVVIGARQFGLQNLRAQTNELRSLYDSVLSSAQLLGIVFAFINKKTPQEAVQFFEQHPELSDHDNIALMLDDQIIKATRAGDIQLYRKVSMRMDLWRHLIEFGIDEGLRQHQRLLANPPDVKTIQAEMGMMLLVETEIPEDRRDIIERFPAIASPHGIKIIDGMLEMLSFNNASHEEYNRYYDVKRLLERCLEVGVDRALAEIK